MRRTQAGKSRSVDFQNRIYGIGSDQIGNIDMSQPSRLAQTTAAAQHVRDSQARMPSMSEIRERMNRIENVGNSNYLNLTRHSTLDNGKQGLGSEDRNTLRNQQLKDMGFRDFTPTGRGEYNQQLEEMGFRDFTGEPSPRGDQETSFMNPPHIAKNFVKGDTLKSSAFEHPDDDYFYDDYDTPGFEGLGSEGMSRMSDSVAAPTTAPASAGMRRSGGTAAPANTLTAGTSGSAANAMDPTGVAGAVIDKANAITDQGMKIWKSHQDADQQREYYERATRPGMHANLHANMWNDSENAKKDMRAQYMGMGNQIFGIPGMIGGYFLGQHMADKYASLDRNAFKTANSARGRVNPQNTGVVNAMNDYGEE